MNSSAAFSPTALATGSIHFEWSGCDDITGRILVPSGMHSSAFATSSQPPEMTVRLGSFRVAMSAVELALAIAVAAISAETQT